MTELAPAPARCLRCRRPGPLCCCHDLVPVATRTHVVILQHPRERTMKMGTARLAHLGLAGSELHVGVRFDDLPQVRALAAASRGRVALLYPGPDAMPIERAAAAPDTLVVVDGTWTTARKLLARSAVLRALPRLAVTPAGPSPYRRIRREPAAHCMSTLEAIVAALGALEGDAARFAPLLAAFERLVAAQLVYAGARRLPFYHERKHRRPRRPSAIETLLGARYGDVVLAQAEGNPHEGGGPHELVQLVALRPSTGARLAWVLRPRRPLAARTPARLGVTAGALAAGAAPAELAAAWAAFLRPDDVVVGWGGFTPLVLATEGAACPPWVDLRGEAARHLGRRPGGAEEAARALGATIGPAWAPGRAGARIAALAALVERLRLTPGRFQIAAADATSGTGGTP
jgi:DTW domain-containing protein YfiP